LANPNLKNAYLPQTRKHVLRGSDWGQTAGTDYWLLFNPGADLMATATAGTMVDELVDGGWVATSMVNTAGTGSDFRGGLFTPDTTLFKKSGPYGGTYGDHGTPNHALTNASGDLLITPAIFGDAAHMEMAATLAGMSNLPRYLIADFWASFTVASANEVRSAIGFYEDTGAAGTEADQYAAIVSDGTNFNLRANAATLDAGPLISTTWHKWRIVLEFNGSTAPNIYWYVDGAIQNTTPAVGIQDEFPLKFGMYALTTNRPGLGLTHIYYDW
jgi:hypothetical protein